MWVIPETSEFYHFVQATEVSNSDWPEHWTQHLMSCLWRSNVTHRLSSVKMRLKKHKWLRKLCGMTLKPSRQKDFEDALISCLRDFRANHLALPAKEKAKKMNGTYGPTLNAQLALFDLNGSSSKMSPDSSTSDSEKCYLTWRNSDTEWKRIVGNQRGAIGAVHLLCLFFCRQR